MTCRSIRWRDLTYLVSLTMVVTLVVVTLVQPVRGQSSYQDVILNDSPLAYFRLNETTGTTAVNEAEALRPGIYNAGVLMGQTLDNPILSDPNNGYAIFGGTSSWVTVDDQPEGQTPDKLNFAAEDAFSLEGWINVLNAGYNGNPIGKSNSVDSSNYFFHMGPSTQGRVRWHTNGWDGNQVDSTTVLTPGMWYHLVGTYDNGTSNIYIGGQLDHGPFQLTPPGSTVGGDFFIGQLGQNSEPPGGDVFSGSLDEVAVYGYALTAEQVLAHFDAAGGGTTSVNERAWRNDASDDWNTPLNWVPAGVPNSIAQTVTFGGVITESRIVYSVTDVTVNKINFLSGYTYVIAGHGTVNLDAGSSTDPSAVDVLLGSHEFQAAVSLNNDTEVTLSSGSSLTFNNTLSLNGNTLTKFGDGELKIRNGLVTSSGVIDIQGGTVSGNGTVGGDLVNPAGIISPGNSLGVLSASRAAVPEPSSLLLLWLGALGCGCLRRRPNC